MGLGIAKVHQKSIPQELGNMSLIALDDFSTSSLIGTHHLPVLFRIELAGEFRGVHEVTKHYRELPTFRVGRRRGSKARGDLRGGLLLGCKRLCRLSYFRSDCLGIADPDENSVILIDGKPF